MLGGAKRRKEGREREGRRERGRGKDEVMYTISAHMRDRECHIQNTFTRTTDKQPWLPPHLTPRVASLSIHAYLPD